MILESTPERVRLAQNCFEPIFNFLAQYKSWMANPKPTDCDFALGNPQTMPLPGFVTALSDATEPMYPGWYAYKVNDHLPFSFDPFAG